MSFLDQDYREIITKAVIGKGRKFNKDTHVVNPTHQPSSILGCWIINHLYNAKRKGDDKVELNGSYDINVWYSYNDHTKTEVEREFLVEVIGDTKVSVRVDPTATVETVDTEDDWIAELTDEELINLDPTVEE